MEPRGPLSHSKQPATRPSPEADQSSPRPHPTSSRSILILSSHVRLGFSSGLFIWGFPSKLCMHLSSLPYMLHSPPISFSILSPEQYCVGSTDHEAPHYVVFSTPLLPRPSQAQISSSAPYSQTPSAYVRPSMWATKFHTHTAQKSCTFSYLRVHVWTADRTTKYSREIISYLK